MDVFEAKYPELDDLPQTDYSTLWNAIKFVINSNDDDFSNHVDEYFDLPRKTDFNPDNLYSRYESYYNILKQSAAAEREEQRWSGDSDVYGYEINFEKELEYIKNWINTDVSRFWINIFNMKMIHSFPILHINLIIQIYIHCLDKELTI